MVKPSRLPVVLLAVLLCFQTGCSAMPNGNAASTRQTGPFATRPVDSSVADTAADDITAGTAAYLPVPTDFVRILDHVPQAREQLVYATADNFTGQEIYSFTTAYLRYGTVQKLAAAARQLAQQGVGLVIWDGYRPLYAQQKLWDICPNPAYVSKPGTGSQSHCRGIAVDVTLYDLSSGELLEMPSGFDEFSAAGDRDYSDCTPTAAANATLLEQVMVSCGFRPYSAEWWHYSDTEEYPVESDFDPAQTG